MSPADVPMETIPLAEGDALPVVGQDEQVEPVRVNWPKPDRVRWRGWLSPTSCSLALHVFILLLFMSVTVRSGRLPPFIDTSAPDTAGTPPLAVEREFNIKPIEDVGSAPAATSIPLRRLFGEPAPIGSPVEGEASGRPAAQAALPGMPAGEGKPFEATGRLRRIGFLVEGKQAYLLFVGTEEEALTVVAGPGINLEALLNREGNPGRHAGIQVQAGDAGADRAESRHGRIIGWHVAGRATFRKGWSAAADPGHQGRHQPYTGIRRPGCQSG